MRLVFGSHHQGIVGVQAPISTLNTSATITVRMLDGQQSPAKQQALMHQIEHDGKAQSKPKHPLFVIQLRALFLFPKAISNSLQ
jgi:hypothetical protein